VGVVEGIVWLRKFLKQCIYLQKLVVVQSFD